jgi:hypothetical protein
MIAIIHRDVFTQVGAFAKIAGNINSANSYRGIVLKLYELFFSFDRSVKAVCVNIFSAAWMPYLFYPPFGFRK